MVLADFGSDVVPAERLDSDEIHRRGPQFTVRHASYHRPSDKNNRLITPGLTLDVRQSGPRQLTRCPEVRREASGEVMIALLAGDRVDAADDLVITQAVAAAQQFDVPGRRAPMGCPPSASNPGSWANADDLRVQRDARSARPRSLRVNLGRRIEPGQAEDPITRPAAALRKGALSVSVTFASGAAPLREPVTLLSVSCPDSSPLGNSARVDACRLPQMVRCNYAS